MALIAYARVSTIEQDLDIQLAKLKAAGAEMIFSEKRSGADTKGRHELERAITTLRAGDVLIVTKLDRFGRNVLDLLRLLDRVKAAGAEFRCIDQPVATDGPMGQLMLTVLSAFAQFENDIRRERQLEGIAAAKERGVFDASRHAIAPGRLSHASRMLGQGLSYAQVSEKTGISVDTLQRRWPKYKNAAKVAGAEKRWKRKRQGSDNPYPNPYPNDVITVTPGPDPAKFIVGVDLGSPAGDTTVISVGGAPFEVFHVDTAPRTLPWTYTDHREGTFEVTPTADHPDTNAKPRRGLLGMFRR